jgi:hypothetical protein
MIAVFLFYDIANGIQSKLSFSKQFKHCNIITFDGRDWIALDFDRTGLVMRKIYCKDGAQLLRNIRVIQSITAIVSVDIAQKKRFMWSPWWVRSCNEVCRYTAGVDIGWSFNPIHLYKKLLKYRHKRNYEILSHWRRKYGVAGQ